MLLDAEPPGDGRGCGDGPDGTDLVGDPAVFAQGLGESLEPVHGVRVLLADDDGADARLPFDDPLAAQQIEGLADGVARDAVVGADGVLVRQDATRERTRAHLVAQQVGEEPGTVRAQPAPAGGGDGHGVLTDAFGWHAVDHTDAVAEMVLPQCCATWGPLRDGCDLRGCGPRRKDPPPGRRHAPPTPVRRATERPDLSDASRRTLR